MLVLNKSGIYKITCLNNNKVYIGQSKHTDYRFAQHLLLLESNRHFNRHLQFCYNKYGKDSLEFKILEFCDETKLTERESYWIDYYGGINSNNTFNVQNATEPNHFTDDVRLKISQSNKR